MDTGADISLIKANTIGTITVNKSRITTISGIGQGVISSLGCARMEIGAENYLVTHDFHVVRDNFPIPCDGLLGMDFIKEFNCILDFQRGQDWFIMRPHGFPDIAVRMTHTCGGNSVVIPARSQVVRRITIHSPMEELLVLSQEPRPGVFISGTIVKSSDAFVRILNTNTHDTVMHDGDILTDDLDNWEMTSVNDHDEMRF